MTKKYYVTWDEIMDGLEHIDSEENIVYGVPKGGMVAAGFLRYAKNVFNIHEANVILDDIIDTGNTRDYYQKLYPDKDFVALFDKPGEGITDWVVFPWETDHPSGVDTIEENVVRQLSYIGEDPKREGLLDTPARVVRSWNELFSGYNQDPKKLVTKFNMTHGYNQIILLKDIELYSMCEHHILPFYGKAHVAYIPKVVETDGCSCTVLGISKLARLVDVYARRLQIQERVGEQVVDFLMEECNALGAACIIEACHLCMRMRGCNKQNATMITSSLKGVFYKKQEARLELMSLINLK